MFVQTSTGIGLGVAAMSGVAAAITAAAMQDLQTYGRNRRRNQAMAAYLNEPAIDSAEFDRAQRSVMGAIDRERAVSAARLTGISRTRSELAQCKAMASQLDARLQELSTSWEQIANPSMAHFEMQWIVATAMARRCAEGARTEGLRSDDLALSMAIAAATCHWYQRAFFDGSLLRQQIPLLLAEYRKKGDSLAVFQSRLVRLAELSAPLLSSHEDVVFMREKTVGESAVAFYQIFREEIRFGRELDDVVRERIRIRVAKCRELTLAFDICAALNTSIDQAPLENEWTYIGNAIVSRAPRIVGGLSQSPVSKATWKVICDIASNETIDR